MHLTMSPEDKIISVSNLPYSVKIFREKIDNAKIRSQAKSTEKWVLPFRR